MRFVLRAFALLGVAGALFLPEESGGGADRFFLVDVSASVRRFHGGDLEKLERVLEPGLRLARGGDRAALLAFAVEARVLLPLQEVSEFRAACRRPLASFGALPSEKESDFEAALRLALSSLSSERRAEVWVWTDGIETRGSLASTLGDLEASRVPIYRLPFPPQTPRDARILGVKVPPQIPSGAEGVAQVELEGDSRRAVRGELILSGAGSERRLPIPLESRERRTLLLPFRPDAEGHILLGFDLEVDGDDPVPENNAASAGVEVGEVFSLRWSGEEAPVFRMLEDAAGLDVRADSGEGFDFFEIWLTNRRDLRRVDSGAKRFVEDGGLWIVCGGVESYAFPSSDPPSEIEDLLPLRSSTEEGEGDDILLLLDASGSMEGEKFDRAAEAAWALARWLGPKVRLRAAVFGEELGPMQVLKDYGERKPASVRLAPPGGAPRGGTNLARALEEGLKLFDARAKGGKRRLFLLSDGKQTVAHPKGIPEIAREYEGAAIEVVAFEVGEDADRATLEQLTADGRNGRVIPVAGMGTLQEEFLREAGASFWDRRPQPVRLASGAPLPGLPAEAPALDHRLKTELRPGAQLLYETIEGRPVLAMKRSGLGAVVALASSLGPEGSPSWGESAGIWLSLIHSLAKKRPRGTLEIENGEIRFTPADAKLQAPELRLDSRSLPAPISLFREGDLYVGRMGFLGGDLPPEDPVRVTSPGGQEFRVRTELRFLNPPEFRGEGRSVLPFFLPPPDRSSSALPWRISREPLLLLALAALLLSFLVKGKPSLGR